MYIYINFGNDLTDPKKKLRESKHFGVVCQTEIRAGFFCSSSAVAESTERGGG